MGLILDPEVGTNEPSQGVRLVASPSPLASTEIDVQMPEGLTLGQMLDASGMDPRVAPWCHVAVDGNEIDPMWWDHVKPKAGRRVTVSVYPTGGGGEGDSNKTLRTVLQIVVYAAAAVLSYFFPALAPVFFLGAAAISVALQFLLPPSFPRRKAQEESSISPSIGGARNQMPSFGQVLPRILGRHRVFPFYGAKPFTELQGSDQFIRLMFAVGLGPYAISDLKIGETSLDDYEDVEVEIRQGFSTDAPRQLYSNQVTEDGVGVDLTFGLPEAPTGNGIGPWYVRTTQPDTDEISVDVGWLKGLGKSDKNQRRSLFSVVEIEYAVAGSGSWVAAESIGVSDNLSIIPLRMNRRWTVARGQYDVRVRQIGIIGHGLSQTEMLMTEATWTVLRSIKHVDPISIPNVATVALRIRATGQLQGIVDTFNCVVESIMPDFESTLGTWVERPTRNPASCFRAVLQGYGNARPLPDNRLDIDGLEGFHDWCVANEFHFDQVLDFESSILDTLRTIARAGRAQPTFKNGTQWSVFIDEPQSVPLAHFSPRNSREYSGRKVFVDVPHALRVAFPNEDNGWLPDEHLVFRDGYTRANASRYESMEYPGVTDADQIWKLGRYDLANMLLRPETHSFTTDFKYLTIRRGGLIRFTHDVPLIGLASARIKALVTSGANTTGLILDELVTQEVATSYSVRVTLADATQQVHALTTVPGESATVTFATPVTTATGPQVGDHVAFGESAEESLELIVKDIDPREDETARITCVDKGAGVWSADGVIPDFDPVVSIPPELRTPPAPVVTDLLCENTQATRLSGGSIGSLLKVGFRVPVDEFMEGARVEAQWRLNGAAVPWTHAGDIPADAQQIPVGPLAPSAVYDVRLRTVSRLNKVSAWVTVFSVEVTTLAGTTFYELTAIPGGWIAAISGQLPIFGPPRVTGLRLVNSISGMPDDTTAGGRDFKFAWNAVSMLIGTGASEDTAGPDPEIEYAVEIWTLGVRRRYPISVGTPGYEYKYELNLEDHKASSLDPQRAITIKVWARHRLTGAISDRPAELAVSNPAPDMSGVLPTLTATAGALVGDWTQFASTDYDLEKFDFLLDTFNPPTTVVATRSKDQRNVFIPALEAVAYYAKVRPYDAFGAGIDSQVATATPLSANTVDFFTRTFTPDGITFSYDPVTSTLSWTAGSLTYTVDGTTIVTRAITADSASWIGGALFIYYVLGETQLRATSTVAVALGSDRAVMAVYSGGIGLTVNWGKAIVAGPDILANSIGANQLVTSTAIITAGAQIANAIINNGHITDLSAGKITAGSIIAAILIGTGRISTASSGSRVELRQDALEVLTATGTYLTDTAVHAPPTTGTYAYNTFKPDQVGFPAVGGLYIDPVFGSEIRRLTNELGQQSNAEIYGRNAYFNSTGTRMHHRGPGGAAIHQIIDTSTGAVVLNNAVFNSDASFSPTDPDVYYYFAFGTTDLKQYSVSTGVGVTIKTFAGNLAALGGSVDNIDRTGRYFVLNIGGVTRVWDKQTDTLYAGSISGTFGAGGWIGISPDGKYVVTSTPGSPPQHHSFLIDHVAHSVDTVGVLFWTLAGDHGDLCTASDGKTYYITYDTTTTGDVYRVDVTLPQTHGNQAQQRSQNRLLLDLDISNDDAHFACPALGEFQDWAFISVESADDVFDGGVGSWRSFEQEIVMVNVLTSEVRRLAHHRSRSTGTDYYRQPKVSVSWDGKIVAWQSDYNYSATGYADIYALTVGVGGTTDTSVFRAQSTQPFVRIGRTGGQVPPLTLSGTGDFNQLVTDQIRNLNIVRFAVAKTSVISVFNDAGEVIGATYSNFIHTLRSTDTIGTWWVITVFGTIDSGTSTTVVRIRRGATLAGPIVAQVSATAFGPGSGGKTGSTTISFAIPLSTIDVQAPGAVGAHSYVLTTTATGTASTLGVRDSVLVMGAKSA